MIGPRIIPFSEDMVSVDADGVVTLRLPYSVACDVREALARHCREETDAARERVREEGRLSIYARHHFDAALRRADVVGKIGVRMEELLNQPIAEEGGGS